MTPEWLFTLITHPQRFWKLLGYYLAAPFTESGIDTNVLSAFLGSILKHPLILLVVTFFVLLLGGSLLASGVAIASKTRREKKEQMERH